MCDYSLAQKASRPAKVGERLTSTAFTGTSSRGFCSLSEPDMAVCVLPGTEISFTNPVRTETRLPIEADVDGTTRIIGVPPKSDDRVATFVQVNKDKALTHHDALEFSDGNIVLLTNLESGQEAIVLQMPAAPTNKAEADAQERVPVTA